MTRDEIFERKMTISKNGIVEDVYGNEFRDKDGRVVIVEPLTNCQGLCPMCESDDTAYQGTNEINNDSISYNVECNSCGKIFVERYDIRYSETVS